MIRLIVRSFEWATGRRHYPWTSSPPHRLFAMIASRARGWPGAQYRAAYGFAVGVLKFRERLHGDLVNFDLRLTGPLNGSALRNTASWLYTVLSLPGTSGKRHINLRVEDNSENVQLDRFISVVLMSEGIGSINFFFDADAARDARVHALTVAEEKRGPREDDLATTTELDLDASDRATWLRIFSTRTGFDRNVNEYLKIAHPDVLVVALSLPEDDAGFCDEAVAVWQEALASFAAAEIGLNFVVLNRVGPATLYSAGGALRSGLSFASRAGMSTAEVISRSKSRRVRRPHGHLRHGGTRLRSARHLFHQRRPVHIE